MDILILTVVQGLLMGTIFSLIAMGFTLTFGVMRIVNFAHGAFVLWAMYFVFSIFKAYNFNPYLTLFIAIPLFFVVGYLFYRFLFHLVYKVSEDMQVLFGFGTLVMLQNLAQYFYSADAVYVKVDWLKSTWNIFGVNFQRGLFVAALIALMVIIVIQFILQKSSLGKSVRACADNSRGAAIVGLNLVKINSITFGISTVAAAIGGVVLATIVTITPERAFEYSLISFMIVLLGGMGNIVGTLAAGLIIGLTTAFGTSYADAQLAQMFNYILILVILLFKPTGLFGGTVNE